MSSSIWLCAINPTDQSLFCQAGKFCPQGTNQNDLLNLKRVHMIFHSSTWEQLSVEYTSTCSQVEFKSTNASQALEYRCRSSTGVQMPCQVHEYRCQSNTGVQTPAKYKRTDASRVHEYRCQPSTWVQMPCQLSCEHKCARGGSHPAATLHHTVKIQCSLKRNH